VESEVFDLFSYLDATEDQLDFPVIYASGRDVLPSTCSWQDRASVNRIGGIGRQLAG